MKIQVYFTTAILELLAQCSVSQSSILQHSSENTVLGNDSIQKACPHWTYRTHQNSNCTCGNSIFGIVSCKDAKSPVYLLTCHCMSLNHWGEVVEGMCPYLCTNHFHTVVGTNSSDLHYGNICNKVIPQNRHGQLCGTSSFVRLYLAQQWWVFWVSLCTLQKVIRLIQNWTSS